MVRFIVLFLCSTLTSNFLVGQTLDKETEFLNTFLQTDMDKTEILKLSNDWRAFLTKNGGYPELPFNEDLNSLDYEFIYSYPNLNKTEITSRIKEYAAINYGKLDEVLHFDDVNSGKLIIKGWFPMTVLAEYENFFGNTKEFISSLKCYHTIIFTIKENKLKVNYQNIDYEAITGGYFNSNVYIPQVINNYSIESLYPITEAKKDSWQTRLNTLVETSERVNEYQLLFNKFLEKTSTDKDF